MKMLNAISITLDELRSILQEKLQGDIRHINFNNGLITTIVWYNTDNLLEQDLKRYFPMENKSLTSFYISQLKEKFTWNVNNNGIGFIYTDKLILDIFKTELDFKYIKRYFLYDEKTIVFITEEV